MNNNLIQKFGYSELYEWSLVPNKEDKIGRFVTFDPEYPGKIKLCENSDNILGVTTVNSVIESDNPEIWHKENLSNEYGDIYLQKERLAVGEKVYDQFLEMSYIKTKPWEHFIPIKNPKFDQNKKYFKRTNRQEWVMVNLLGKVIVKDDGTCVPGEYCTLVNSKLKNKQGTVTKASPNDTVKFYVLSRISKETILILNK